MLFLQWFQSQLHGPRYSSVSPLYGWLAVENIIELVNVEAIGMTARVTSWCVLFIALVVAGGPRAYAAAPAPSHPNIIVVLIDDMGWGDFSCFGNKQVQTTNIDRLASEGLRFEQ